MDFDHIDIDAFLKASIPHRFQDISPYDFEAFVAILFRRDGYEVTETGYSGDFGADLLVEKKGKKTAVQIKRYAPGSLVGVKDINQAIAACSYYNTGSALVITTSDFTAPGIELAKSGNVILWNWQRLVRYISTTLMDEQTYEERYGDVPTAEELDMADDDTYFQFVLTELNDETLADGSTCIALHAELKNISGNNLTVHLDLPIIITRKSGKQVSALRWKDNYYSYGLIVSEATVEVACYFLTSQIAEIRRGDRILIRAHVTDSDSPVLIDEILGSPKGNCYLVTHCYGRDSAEYSLMIRFRDSVLSKTRNGRAVIDWYYDVSPHLLRLQDWARLPALIINTTIKCGIKMALWFAKTRIRE